MLTVRINNHIHICVHAVAKLDPNDRGGGGGGAKMYIPKNFYTKTTYITLLSEKFGGSGTPSRPFYTLPLCTCLHGSSPKILLGTLTQTRHEPKIVSRHLNPNNRTLHEYSWIDTDTVTRTA
ncbi:hypothetical protein HanRHA438_Chr08g0329241 [Helianthus annuus]|nr:hypothetical protein HanRHA438_Chr08g0329241 [Helianthus annuus]